MEISEKFTAVIRENKEKIVQSRSKYFPKKKREYLYQYSHGWKKII